MGLMTLNLATLNVRRLRDSNKCVRLLAELKKFRVNVAAVQETHFICAAKYRVLVNDFNVFSAYLNRSSTEVSLLVGRSLDAVVNVVFVCDGGGLLVVADIAVKSFEFWLVAVLGAQYRCGEDFLFSSVVPFLDDSKRLVLMGD